MIVSKSIEFCAAHRVLTHGGKCRHAHGHRWKVTVYVDGDVASDGMVLDFGILSAVLRARVHDRLDHGTVLDRTDPLAALLFKEDPGMVLTLLNGPPTAEELCHFVLNEVGTDARMTGFHVVQVDVQETPSSIATLVVNR